MESSTLSGISVRGRDAEADVDADAEADDSGSPGVEGTEFAPTPVLAVAAAPDPTADDPQALTPPIDAAKAAAATAVLTFMLFLSMAERAPSNHQGARPACRLAPRSDRR